MSYTHPKYRNTHDERVANGLYRRPSFSTTCGYAWDMLFLSSCPKCNADGAHYHNDKGECELEPCMRHGGPN